MIAFSPGFLGECDIGPAKHSTNQTESANPIQRLVFQPGGVAGGLILSKGYYITRVAFSFSVHSMLPKQTIFMN
jgi:hypothetical protein